MVVRTRLFVVFALVVSLLASCRSQKTVTTAPSGNDRAATTPYVHNPDAPKGLVFRLSEAKDEKQSRAIAKVGKSQKLDKNAIARLLARVPKIKAPSGDEKTFALRDRSQPVPLTGTTIGHAFPPPPSSRDASSATAPGVGNGPLKVVRHAPEGQVPLAPHVSITFSEPMVAVTSHDDTVAAGVPAKLKPQPAGKWRWVGTKTLLFDPDVRFPMATRYTVTVPADVASALGHKVRGQSEWTFATPPPQLVRSFPVGGPRGLRPVMFAQFDQKIDEGAVLASIKVTANARTLSVRPASNEEIAADPEVSALVERAIVEEQQGRFVTFRVDEALPRATTIDVAIGPGTPSAEGPLRTKEAQKFSFHTFEPLKVLEFRCSWGKECPPGQPWYVRFNNPLDEDQFKEESIKISPELPRRRINQQGQHLNIQGASKANTTYKITLVATLADKFGQTLGEDVHKKIRTGNAQPSLTGPSGLVVLDPAAKARLSVFSINQKKLKVRAYAVTPKDWQRYTQYTRNFDRNRTPPTPPGRLVINAMVTVKGPADELTETAIDFQKALPGGFGHLIFTVEPTQQPKYGRHYLHGWLQSTQIGLDAFVDSTDLFAWTTALKDGKPLKGATLEIWPDGQKGTSDARGLSTIALAAIGKNQSQLLIARQGKDVAFVPESTSYWSNHTGWRRREASDSLRWFVFDDRKMYRPGETAHVKGWVRRLAGGELGDYMALAGAAKEVEYQLNGSRGNEMLKGKAPLNAAGGFDLKLVLPKTPNLGRSYLRLTAVGGTALQGSVTTHSFDIQEFRRPEFEVTATASTGPHMIADHAEISVKAAYFAGGALPGADTTWSVSAQPGSFVPPNRSDFVFGEFVAWWGWYRRDPVPANYQNLKGKTDATGTHRLRVDFLSANPARAMTLRAQATVMDKNRQAWSATSELVVHPAAHYVGLRSKKVFVDKGDAIEIDGIVVDLDGKAVLQRSATLRAVRLEWRYKKGQWQETEQDAQDCQATSADKPFLCRFKTPEGGRYRITARIEDTRDRPNETVITVWVSGGKSPPSRDVKQEKVELIPDQKEYKPGDVAKVLVQSPFFPAEAFVSYRRGGIFHTERFLLSEASKTIEVPVRDEYTPNFTVAVDLVGASPRLLDSGEPAVKLPKRPAFAHGELSLSVPPAHRKLAVKVSPRAKKVAPGEKTSVDVEVRDAKGRPVKGAEVAVVIVDESVLSLTGYRVPDPLDAFYFLRDAGVRAYRARSYVRLAEPDLAQFAVNNAQRKTVTVGAIGLNGDSGRAFEDSADGNEALAGAEEATPAASPPTEDKSKRESRAGPARVQSLLSGKKTGGQQAPTTPIAVRQNFNALATFAPALATDAKGRARVAVKMPDNLTRYRIMAVAVAGEKQFGHGESTITARMPLMLRPSPPRFLNFGDHFELPVMVQNQTDRAVTVSVAVRATNAKLLGGAGQRITVPANDRAEIRFASAAHKAGAARFQIAAAAGRYADASDLSLPVWTPATTEAFATYGSVTGTGPAAVVHQPVKQPSSVVTEFGGLEVTLSSTQLQALTDAFLYLIEYPFECTEQISSRVLAVAALRDVLSAFKAKGLPAPKEILATVARDIKELGSLQNSDGGFAFWRRGDRSWPYISIHAAHAMVRAKDKGFLVPDGMRANSLRYLRAIESHIPHWYSLRTRRTLIAYALSVRKRMGDPDTARARRLISEAGLPKLPLEAVGWLLHTLSGNPASRPQVNAIHRHLLNRATETAATAHFATQYADGAHLLLHSDRRADAVILEALMIDQPKNGLIEKIVRGLLAHRKRGRWSNTQENAFVLLAMDKYFHTFEKITPNFLARAWLGQNFAGEQQFTGRQTDRHHVNVAMADLGKEQQNLTLQKNGKGRLYYRIGMTYAPKSLRLEAADHGFAVARNYEGVDDPADVARGKDGTWQIRAGARVRVRLTMVVPTRRYHVALVDPLPAGLEPMNPALAVTGDIVQDPKQKKDRYWWWYRSWFEHQNMRDERVEAFSSLVWAGVHTYTYVARATTPGNFVVPPSKAEEMYFPETFGRSASDRVVVK